MNNIECRERALKIIVQVLAKMNAIWRKSVSCLRIGKVPHRYKSGCHPTVPLGSRILTDPNKVFEHNMWDHIQWSEEEEAAARKKVEENSAVQILLEEQVDRKSTTNTRELSLNHVKTNMASCLSRTHCSIPEEEEEAMTGNAGSSGGPRWTGFDFSIQDSEEHRKTPLKTDLFPGGSATFRILEVGCGAGNSVFPILNILQNMPGSFLYCCDFSSEAVELVKSHPSYRAAQCSAFVHDVCADGVAYPFPDGTLDVGLLVFVLSSVHPDRMQSVVNRLSKLLKPGGMLLFRDYGRYDKTQLRFKKGCCLSENFYVRGDGTRAYFFTRGEVHTIFCKAGLDEKQNLVDRRLQVNRKKQVKMHRVWVQGKFQKPLHSN
ncbi:tRNA N(3)-cytidine methyltransferase METTL8, mitochondrial isoform X3 [Tenrec ecaudatus]|uniref:tRNA N(3)-cytidine methyltransferase METTL8, mitochondrial isoform X3 n=1 Tax=Tenrec ecaudatus TaxID=94439 RepID=UPI003F5AA753